MTPEAIQARRDAYEDIRYWAVHGMVAGEIANYARMKRDEAMQTEATKPEPDPQPGGEHCWPSLIAAIASEGILEDFTTEAITRVVVAGCERHQDGIKKYSTSLQTNNGRNPLVDALQESLDLSVYLHQAVLECGSWPDRRNKLIELRNEAVVNTCKLLKLIDDDKKREART